MLIRRLTENDLDALWKLRLQALSDNPEAFGSTYQETIDRGTACMLERLRRPEQEFFYLGAFHEESLIGMVGFVREDGVKECHKASVISLFVLPQARGLGAGKALVQELITRAKQLLGLEQLRLAVVTANEAACTLYLSLGFEICGTAPRSLKMGDQYWDEHLMILYLE